MSKILTPLATGFEEIEAISVIDITRRANIETITASLDDSLLVNGAHNIKIEADEFIKDVEIKEFDMIVLPGGLGGTNILSTNEIVQNMLRYMKKEKFVAAICAAPYALHKADALNAKYTCYPNIESKISKEGYDDRLDVVIDGNVITSKGPATAIYFALEIVKALQGKQAYNKLKKELLVD